MIDNGSSKVARFAAALSDAAEMLDNLPCNSRVPKSESLPSLLEQATHLCEEVRHVWEQPIRMIHHFACTGGTTISKCIASMPNVHLLSEVDPLSDLEHRRDGFCPTDLIALLKRGTRQPDQSLLVEIFSRGIEAIYEDSRQRGLYLVIRDHSHSHFCVGAESAPRPTVREMLSTRYPIRSLLTVRHPLDSWLSLVENGWIHFDPKTISEYSNRYLCFLDRHQACELMRYEDFVNDPVGSMRRISQILELPFDGSFLDLFHVHTLSGNSGRQSADISMRARRPVPAELENDMIESAPFRELCGRLGYEDVLR